LLASQYERFPTFIPVYTITIDTVKTSTHIKSSTQGEQYIQELENHSFRALNGSWALEIEEVAPKLVKSQQEYENPVRVDYFIGAATTYSFIQSAEIEKGRTTMLSHDEQTLAVLKSA
jgi:hypothetical protein